MKNIFIFEGVKGAGKTTLIKKLKEHIEAEGKTVRAYFEEESFEFLRHVKVIDHIQRFLNLLLDIVDSENEEIILLDRFHITHVSDNMEMYKQLEERLNKHNTHGLFLTVSPSNIRERLTHTKTNRPSTWHMGSGDIDIETKKDTQWQQNVIKNYIPKSLITWTEINTDNMNWSQYTEDILKTI